MQFIFKSKDLPGRLARWSLLLQQHDFQVVYCPGRLNIGPDALCRHPVDPAASISAIWISYLQVTQEQDSYCQSLRALSSLPPEISETSNILPHRSTPILPESMKNETFTLLHELPSSGHFGYHRTLKRFQRLYWFPNLKSYVSDKVRRCRVCQVTQTIL